MPPPLPAADHDTTTTATGSSTVPGSLVTELVKCGIGRFTPSFIYYTRAITLLNTRDWNPPKLRDNTSSNA